MNRPRQVLMQALQEDLQPMVRQLREMGWPAEVWVVKETEDVPFHVAVRVNLDGMPGPVETTPNTSEEA
jgi:hypothetical protein